MRRIILVLFFALAVSIFAFPEKETSAFVPGGPHLEDPGGGGGGGNSGGGGNDTAPPSTCEVKDKSGYEYRTGTVYYEGLKIEFLPDGNVYNRPLRASDFKATETKVTPLERRWVRNIERTGDCEEESEYRVYDWEVYDKQTTTITRDVTVTQKSGSKQSGEVTYTATAESADGKTTKSIEKSSYWVRDVTSETVRNWIKSGKISGKQLSGHRGKWFIPLEEFEYLKQRKAADRIDDDLKELLGDDYDEELGFELDEG